MARVVGLTPEEEQTARIDDAMSALGDIYIAVLKWQDNASVVGMLEAHYDDKPDDLVDITRRMIKLCDERGLKV